MFLLTYYRYYHFFFNFLLVIIIVPGIEYWAEMCGLSVCTESAKQSIENSQNIPGQIAQFRACSWPQEC